jgi:hypothetical protein
VTSVTDYSIPWLSIILKWILQEYDERLWAVCSCVGTWLSGKIFWKRSVRIHLDSLTWFTKIPHRQIRICTQTLHCKRSVCRNSMQIKWPAAFATCSWVRLDSTNVSLPQWILGRETFWAAERMSAYRILCYMKCAVRYYIRLIYAWCPNCHQIYS